VSEVSWRFLHNALIMFRRMKHETPEQRWNRLQQEIQDGILRAYPNAERKGCPSAGRLLELAVRSAEFDDTIEGDAQWQHVMHCSPCYSQYLEEFRRHRRRATPPSSK